MEPIPIVSDVRPLADPAFTRAPEPLPDTCYLKHQNFLSYMDATDRPEFATLILTEVEACEVLRLHPHPNIAPYLGCVVENSHIKGPCFPKYSTILAHMLKDKVEFDRAFVQRDIEAGVEHMHKLGLLHGDLNPTNIMFDGNSAVIIDFDSCKKQSKKLGAKGGTPGWDLADAEYARRENDLYSLSLIATALENRYECIA
jgi:serine/threonine protein kinase